MQLNAGPQPVGKARVLEPVDASFDEVAEHVSQPQFLILTGQQEVDEIVHGPTEVEQFFKRCDRLIRARACQSRLSVVTWTLGIRRRLCFLWS